MSTINQSIRYHSQTTVPFQSQNSDGKVCEYSNLNCRKFSANFPGSYRYLNISAPKRPNVSDYTVCVYSVGTNQIRQLEFTIDHIPAEGLIYISQYPIKFPKDAIVTKIQHFMGQFNQLTFEEEIKLSNPLPSSP